MDHPAPRPTDPMRVLAWIILVVGFLVMVGAVTWASQERARYGRIADANPLRMEYWWTKQEEVSATPGLAVGAGLSAFGLLLLAIRRPGVGATR